MDELPEQRSLRCIDGDCVDVELVQDEFRAALDELDVHVLVPEDTGAVLVGGADEPDDAEHVAAVDDGRADGKGFRGRGRAPGSRCR